MSKNGNKEKEFFSSSFINISLIITILLIIILPSVIKMNKGYFWVGIIISFFLMNILITFDKVLNYDNSWYTQKYEYNSSYVYNQAINDLYNSTKRKFSDYTNATYYSIKNSFNFTNIKENAGYLFNSIGNGIKNLFQRKPKAEYKPQRKKYS